MRHGLHGFTRRVWGLPGHQPVAAMKQVYQWGNVYGVVGLGLARRDFLLAKTVDQAHLGRLYRQIVDSAPAAIHVSLQDGAGFHVLDGHANLPDNVWIVTPLPYSPKLNPVERLWDQLKDGLCNRVFASLTKQRKRIVSWLQIWSHGPCRVSFLIPS